MIYPFMQFQFNKKKWCFSKSPPYTTFAYFPVNYLSYLRVSFVRDPRQFSVRRNLRSKSSHVTGDLTAEYEARIRTFIVSAVKLTNRRISNISLTLSKSRYRVRRGVSKNKYLQRLNAIEARIFERNFSYGQLSCQPLHTVPLCYL